MNNKKIVIPAIALIALSLIGVLSIRHVKADENSTYPPIVQKLIERFNLNEQEVKQVFDEEREERQKAMQARFEQRLNEAMAEGKITQQQKEAILAKREEMRANQENMWNLTPEERQKRREEHREEMKKWAEENGIDLSLLPALFGMGRRGGFGGLGLGR